MPHEKVYKVLLKEKVMNINNNLQNLYAAQQQKAAYNDYQAKTKKGEKVEDNLFGTADKNGDNKVNKNDLTAINNEITKLTKDKLLYDIDGDKKVTLTDLMEFDVNTDIDGDGKVSDAEKKFLEEQKNTLIKTRSDCQSGINDLLMSHLYWDYKAY